jgi:hypothetical protein
MAPVAVRIAPSAHPVRMSPIRFPPRQLPREPTVAPGPEASGDDAPPGAAGCETPAKQSTTTARMIHEMMNQPLLTGGSSAFAPRSVRDTPRGGDGNGDGNPASTSSPLSLVSVFGRALFPEPDPSAHGAPGPDGGASPVSQGAEV